jgi:hypothetical protein
MGSMINLAVGRLEIDWGKNNGFADHSALFQAGDVMQIPYYYAGKEIVGPDGKPDWEVIIEMQEGLSKPLSQVIDRINLLGHTTAVCEREFSTLASFNGFDPNSFSFSDLRTALATVDVQALSPNYGEGGEDFGKFFRREILPRLDLKEGGPDPMELGSVAEGMENMSAYTILQLLAANPTASGLDVRWAFHDIETGGWAKRSDFVRPLDQASRFLVVTEGSSDAAIIGKAFQLLRPHIADFFDFVAADRLELGECLARDVFDRADPLNCTRRSEGKNKWECQRSVAEKPASIAGTVAFDLAKSGHRRPPSAWCSRAQCLSWLQMRAKRSVIWITGAGVVPQSSTASRTSSMSSPRFNVSARASNRCRDGLRKATAPAQLRDRSRP